MDLGSFFGGVGNFLGGLFGNNQKKKKDEQTQQVSVQKPTVSVQPNLSQPAGIKMPTSLVQNQQTPFQAPTLGGIQMNAPDQKSVAQAQQSLKIGGSGAPFKPEVITAANKANFAATPAGKPVEKPIDYNNPLTFAGEFGKEWINNAVGGVKATVVDPFVNTAKLGGDLIAGGIGRVTNNQGMIDRANAATAESFKGSIPGLAYQGAEMIARPLGASIAYNEQYDKITKDPNTSPEMKQWLLANLENSVNQETANANVNTNAPEWQNNLNIGLGGLSVILDTLGGAKAAESLLNLPKTISNRVSNTATDMLTKNAVNAGDNLIPALKQAPIEDLATVNKKPINTLVEELPTTKIKEIGSSITSVPPSLKTPGITSPAQEAIIATQVQPTIAPQVLKNMPTNVGGIKAPEIIQAPKVAAPKPVTALDIAQKNIDEMTVKTPEAPVTPVVNNLETPSTTVSKQIAETTTPVSETAVNASNAAEAINKAPTEAIANNIDPRVAKSNTEVDKLIQKSDKELASEGSSYAQVVRKLSNTQTGKEVLDLTAAERKVANAIQPKVNKVIDKMNKLGLTDKDMGIIADYLPTSKLDELNNIKNLEDVMASDFGFTKGRKGKLSNADIESGAAQSLKNYLATGELLDDLSPEFINKVKLARRDKEFIDLIEVDGKGGNTGLKLTDQEINTARANNQKLIDTEIAKAKAQERVAKGDTSSEAISAQNKAEADATDAFVNKQAGEYLALERKTDAEIKNIKSSKDLPADIKDKRIAQLEAHLADVRNQTYYMQSGVRTNLLFGVGRIADQVNKGVQSVSDKLTAASRIGANNSFSKSIGRDLYANNATANAVWNKVKNSPAINQAKINQRVAETVLRSQNETKSLLGKTFGSFKMAGTRLTEAGSRYKIAAKDTTSYFASKAQAEGITDINGITKYVQDAIGTSEWTRVNNAMFEARNSFTGLATKNSNNLSPARILGKEIPNARRAIYDVLGNVPGLSRNARENIADGITIPIAGFPRLMMRLGARGLDNTTGGLIDFFKASRIKPRTEAEALKKALLMQQGFRAAQTTASLAPLGFALGASGMTTGAYPEKGTPEAARWEKDKIQPFSLKVGDTYVDIGRYAGPLAFPLMIGASFGRGDGASAPATVAELAKQISKNYGADSLGDVLSTAGSLMKMDFESTQKDTSRWLAGMTAAFVPASSALGTIGKAEDIANGNAAPETGGSYTDALRAKFPITREGLPGKTDTLGNPISQGGPATLLPGVSGGQSTYRAKTDNRNDRVMSEIDRLAKEGYEVMPSKDIKNLNAQTDTNQLMDTKLYKEADTKTQSEYFNEALLGTKTKNINKDLDPAQRTALIEHAIMPTDKRDVWLEDNDNAANYYSANYDNMKANKTLTAKDNNLEYKTGALYLKKKAEVNKAFGADTNLQQLYDKITLAEWRAMVDNESEDFDLATAEKLMAYDKARTEAGVSGKDASSSKPKYTEKTSGKGKAGKDFAFASMPSSLIGSAGSSKGYADNAPTFKPIADLQAPTGAEIPKGRTISIKKGINL